MGWESDKISIHAPHTGRDRKHGLDFILDPIFQSTRPIRGATAEHRQSRRIAGISIHAPHTGRDHRHRHSLCSFCISIHAPHTGRDAELYADADEACEISIHAPHTGRDKCENCGGDITATTISIHAPHTGRDRTTTSKGTRMYNFNPRAPYGARPKRDSKPQESRTVDDHFNPRAPYGARLVSIIVHENAWKKISIHAPHTGRDQSATMIKQRGYKFQSTRPIRGATCLSRCNGNLRGYFNPRAPYGARPYIPRVVGQAVNISIHAPHTGRDEINGLELSDAEKFQSTRPIRGATFCV